MAPMADHCAQRAEVVQQVECRERDRVGGGGEGKKDECAVEWGPPKTKGGMALAKKKGKRGDSSVRDNIMRV
jgi:hypothetical protein